MFNFKPENDDVMKIMMSAQIVVPPKISVDIGMKNYKVHSI